MPDESETSSSPRKEDVLFKNGADWWNNAYLHSATGSDHHGYTEGYRRAARVLVEQVIERKEIQDYLIFPVIFLYRHHIELALKDIFRRVSYLLDVDFTHAKTLHLEKHRLDLLWLDLKPLLAQLSPQDWDWEPLPAVEVEGIDSYIEQLSKLDRDSFSFRYSRSKQGKPSLPTKPEVINLRHFAEMMERLADCLNALNSATLHLEDMKTDMEEDLGSTDEG